MRAETTPTRAAKLDEIKRVVADFAAATTVRAPESRFAVFEIHGARLFAPVSFGLSTPINVLMVRW